jgi:3-hydroxyisobutyrate dehydrogenase-like beta-hydroxyacid dehydrogenase
MARGLGKERGVEGITAYDIRFEDAGSAGDLKQRAADAGVRACSTMAEALADADIALSLVVGSAAVKVGEAAGRHMRAGQVFVDLNSISPEAKRRVRDALSAGGPAEFVEGAVMARVPPFEHKVPILVAGDAAPRVSETLNGLGMQLEVVGDKVGQACAVKMIRSVVVKGVEALLLESLTAAEKEGVTERILDSISETFPGIDWRQTATYYLGRTHQHGARRQTEMNESAATLRSFGMPAALSTAIAATIGAAHPKLKASGLPYGSEYPALLAVLARDEEADEIRGAAE